MIFEKKPKQNSSTKTQLCRGPKGKDSTSILKDQWRLVKAALVMVNQDGALKPLPPTTVLVVRSVDAP